MPVFISEINEFIVKMTPDPYNLTLPLPGGKTLTVNTVSNTVTLESPAPGTPAKPGAPLKQGPPLKPGTPADPEIDLEGIRTRYKRCCGQARQETPLVGVLSSEMSPEKAAAAFDALAGIRRQLRMDRPPLIVLAGQMPSTRVLDFCLRECDRSGWPVRLHTGSRFPDAVLRLLETLPVEEVTATVPFSAPDPAGPDSQKQEILTAVDRLLYNSPVRIRLEVPVTDPSPAFLSDLADHIIGRQWYMTPHFKAVLIPGQDSPGPAPFDPEHLNNIQEMMTALPKLEVFDLSGWDSSQAVRQLVHTGSFPSIEEMARDTWSSPLMFTPAGEIVPCIDLHHPGAKPAGQYWPEFKFDPDSYLAWLEEVPVLLDHCGNCFLMPVGERACRQRMTASDTTFDRCQWARDLFIRSLLRAEAQGDLP